MGKRFILLGFFLTAAAAFACGDKLMVIMRLRVAQLKLGHPVTILAYAQRDLQSSALVRQIQLYPAVKKAGHRFEFIEDAAQFDEALKTAKYDVVLADVAVADALSRRAKSSPYRPVVVPVSYRSTRQEDSVTQKKFHCLLKTPSNAEDYFVAIDQALQWKAKNATR